MLTCNHDFNCRADSILSPTALSENPRKHTIFGWGWEKWEGDGLSQPIFHFGYMAVSIFSINRNFRMWKFYVFNEFLCISFKISFSKT